MHIFTVCKNGRVGEFLISCALQWTLRDKTMYNVLRTLRQGHEILNPHP